ncbi:single-stranded-DNA-specific exonuclease RecJ [Candidatus Pelagibacter sp. HIMB1321]|uniref:single-stranded-DNA-specific exonuclease RecJ n=1 Tax=Candidatus Pelagibacter sp. HIMB1321 TaxID=1388755 RepID=UPI000A07DD9F|nr:DHH family phosphoesterase [Candidatus Pelagibacter sp. HIMB1321]SMF75483.1 single-stranded-DNA-specific exonuclease [Candidatus Pelagibacter sp. HIMB1321]
MRSVSSKNWEEFSINRRILEKIKIENNLSEILAKIIIANKFSDEEIYSTNNTISYSNPFHFNNDFNNSCKILKKHINKKNKILVIGDYDVDGCVSTSLLINFFKKINLKADYYIPNRIRDGYGVNYNLIKYLVKRFNPDLVFMVDCGSNTNEPINYLKKKNIECLIIDHHNINKPYPAATYIINPKKECDYNIYDYYCSAFLTFFFLDVFIKKNSLNVNLKDLHIYIALATIADVMPLRRNNRFFLQQTLKNFDLNKNLIFKKIFQLKKIKKKLDYNDLAFLIAPMFNSAGRIHDANIIVKLLTTNNEDQIKKIIIKLDNFNTHRKNIQNNFLNNNDLNKYTLENGIIFIDNKDLHEGIIGIIASKIKELFNKPCIVFSKSNSVYKGSARSTYDFNIGNLIKTCVDKNMLISGGGHNLAAGLNIQKNNIKDFKKFLDSQYLKNKSINKNKYISKISFSSLNLKFLNEISKLEPFGNLNENPYFLVENVKIKNPSVINDNLITLYLKQSSKSLIKAISFNPIRSKISDYLLNYINPVNLILRLDKINWNNKTNIQIKIVDIITPNKA